eukprot:3251673-Pyramimonas_sp.AAC.1
MTLVLPGRPSPGDGQNGIPDFPGNVARELWGFQTIGERRAGPESEYPLKRGARGLFEHSCFHASLLWRPFPNPSSRAGRRHVGSRSCRS